MLRLSVALSVFACLFVNPLRAAEPATGNGAPGDVVVATERDASATEPEEPRVMREPEVLEELVERTLAIACVDAAGNTLTHYGIAAAILFGTLIVRRVVARGCFALFRNLAGRTPSKLDGRLVRAIERPAVSLVTLVGVVAACRVLVLPPAVDVVVRWGAAIGFRFWCSASSCASSARCLTMARWLPARGS